MHRPRQGDVSKLALACLVLTFFVASVSGPSACAQGSGGWFGGLLRRNPNRGFYPYYGSELRTPRL